eukprot:960082-Amphidinium_carterae.1
MMCSYIPVELLKSGTLSAGEITGRWQPRPGENLSSPCAGTKPCATCLGGATHCNCITRQKSNI